MIGHHGLTVGRSALPSDLDAGDGWKLLQARIVEGVGGVVRHLGRDLQGTVISYQRRQQIRNKSLNEQYAALKHTLGKPTRTIT